MQVDITQNYFELFGVPVDFHLDKDVLHAAHLKLQAAFHPDRFINGTEQEKRLAVQKAAWINEAYEVLKNPVKRARYMLEVSGLEMNDDHETTSDTAFLIEQIELREEMDECRSCKDPMRCCDHITGKLDQRSKEFSTSFISLYQQGYLEQARQVSKKMQFVERILEQIDEYQLELEDDIL
ncbi:MAG: Fe-S protein assembly co-chaperone HscB [Gammaproteobacteria bacterium]|nr:Fe-S protein assembly co-chaperone HscB [Gammaproteobacteria bacterium]